MGRNLLAFGIVGLMIVVDVGCGSASRSSAETTDAAGRQDGEPAAKTHHGRRPRPWYLRGQHGYEFQSPTGNIRCYTPDAKPKELFCKTLNNGRIVGLGWLTPMTTGWRGGGPWLPSRTLAYGRYWTSPFFICWSNVTDVRCRSIYSRQGFKINRSGIVVWIWARSILMPGTGGGGGGSIPGGNGYPVLCADGTTSYSGGIQGACSWHGGEAG